MLSNAVVPCLLTAASLFASADAALDPIVIKGSKFFYKTSGNQFYMKGVAYQQGIGSSGSSTSGSNSSTTVNYSDPLANAANCARDVPFLQKIGTNVIRTYAINPAADHSACMALLDAAGIYVISDLSEPNQSINRASPMWNTALFARYSSVIDSLQNYTNVIGFFAGNEVSNSPQTTNATAYVKAAVRDMKAYIKNKNYRAMGVGYAADDDAVSRASVANYLNCGDVSSAIDFWGYNIYEWCGMSSFTQSGYNQRTAEFANYTVPTFFAEYGCNNVPGGAAARPFTEVQALYGPQMNNVFSGGIVYEYFEETNDYGLVSISGNAVVTNAGYNALSTQLASVATITGTVNAASYTPTNTVQRSCPTVDSSWQAAASPALPPTPNQALCACMVSSLSCRVKSTTSSDNYGTLFGQVCGYNNGKACTGIAASPSTGVYGAYSMCSADQQLSFVFDQYYKSQNNAATACDFGGAASVVAASAASSCSALLGQAGAAGTGVVTSQPSGGALTTGTSAATAAASSSKAAGASGLTVGASFGPAGFALGAYIVAAMGVGAAMVVV